MRVRQSQPLVLAEDGVQDRRSDRGRHFGDTRFRDSGRGAGAVPVRGPRPGLAVGCLRPWSWAFAWSRDVVVVGSSRFSMIEWT